MPVLKCSVYGCGNRAVEGQPRCWPHLNDTERAEIRKEKLRAERNVPLVRKRVTIQFFLGSEADAEGAVRRYRHILEWRDGFKIEVEEVAI